MAVFGIQMGNDKVTQWLTSFASSIFSSVFLTQPIKIFVVTTIMVFLCRKSNDTNDLIYEGDDEDETAAAKRDLSKLSFSLPPPLTQPGNAHGRLTASELSTARKLRVREVLFWKLVREIFGLVVFFGILFQYSFSNRSASEFAYQSHLRKMLATEFEPVRTPPQFWLWMRNEFLPIFNTKRPYYNRNLLGNTGRHSLKDLTSNVIGYAQVKKSMEIKISR